MQALVGKLLVGEVVTGYSDGGHAKWRGTWSLFHSPSGNGRDWQMIDRGAVPGPFHNEQEAIAATRAVGVDHARTRQRDMTLPVESWRMPFPDVCQ